MYNLISSPRLQVNARFVFLSKGPVVDGVRGINCWTHVGSYLGDMAYQVLDDDGLLHTALLSPGPADTGFSVVQVDGEDVEVGDSVVLGSFSLTFHSTHRVRLSTPQFLFEVDNSDRFLNQAMKAQVELSALLGCHGLLGQTHSARQYATKLRWIEGRVDDYLVAEDNLQGTDFMFNRFKPDDRYTEHTSRTSEPSSDSE